MPRTLELSGTHLDVNSATALSDLLTIEWGLRKLALKECDLDDLVRREYPTLTAPDTQTIGAQAHPPFAPHPEFTILPVYCVEQEPEEQFVETRWRLLVESHHSAISRRVPEFSRQTRSRVYRQCPRKHSSFSSFLDTCFHDVDSRPRKGGPCLSVDRQAAACVSSHGWL